MVSNETGAKYVEKIPLDPNDPILTNEDTCKYVVANYNCAGKLCAAWNNKFPDACNFEFIRCVYSQNRTLSDEQGKNVYTIHEKYLDGAPYVKWNNNMGFLNE